MMAAAWGEDLMRRQPDVNPALLAARDEASAVSELVTRVP